MAFVGGEDGAVAALTELSSANDMHGRSDVRVMWTP